MQSNEDVARIIESEGLGYAVTSYLSAHNIADPELQALWGKAKTALDDISYFLSDFLED